MDGLANVWMNIRVTVRIDILSSTPVQASSSVSTPPIVSKSAHTIAGRDDVWTARSVRGGRVVVRSNARHPHVNGRIYSLPIP